MQSNAMSRAYPLFTLLAGLVCFLTGGVIGGAVSRLISGEIVILAIGVPVGTLLMLLLLRRFTKKTIIKAVIWSEFAGLAGFFAGFIIGESVSGIIGFFFPALLDLSQSKAQIIPNIVVLIIADAVFGAVISYFLYGRRAVGFFAVICAAVSVPFGVLLSMPLDMAWIGFDQNLLFTVLSFGTATGLSIGLYRLLRLKDI